MRIPLHLKRRETAFAAIAAYVPGRDAASVLELCAGRKLDPSGRVFDVSGGFLVMLPEPTRAAIPGAVRLRALAEDLYLPADAELSPALLDDELSGLTRDRGLVFLPGSRALAFDPSSPLPASMFLTLTRVPGRAWEPLPLHIPLANRIDAILVDLPEETPETILDDAGDGDPIGGESPAPEAAGPASTMLGKASLEIGKGFAWLGKALHSRKIAAIGSGMIDQAVRLAPKLTEELLGRQSAALRNLLREFREGNIERALRRALPLGESGDVRGASPSAGDSLPERPFGYGLDDLLSGPDRGGGSRVWFGAGDVMAELTREYRKAAEEALRRGDYRRAAAIYGKLLRDYRAAAQALLRGGLHHDAAILLLNKLDDRRAAAREFEAAGEFDRAVQLYRQVGDHESAGDLLQKIGEEEAAVEEYLSAADHLCNGTTGYLAAGRLLLIKAHRPDLALERFTAAWSRRPGPNVTASAIEAVKIHADRGDVAAIHRILDEADAYFVSSEGTAAAGVFYNGIATLSDRPNLASSREHLRDRVLMALAAQMRRRAVPGQNPSGIAAALLSLPGTWPAPVVSDGAFAITAAPGTRVERGLEDTMELSLPSRRPGGRVRVGTGVVTAAASAALTGTAFIGFEKGEVYAFRPGTSEVVEISTYYLPVTALATDESGEHLVVLRSNESGRGVLSAYAEQADGSYRLLNGKSVADLKNPWLTPIYAGTGRSAAEPFVGLGSEGTIHLLWALTLNTSRTYEPMGDHEWVADSYFRTGLLLDSNADDEPRLLANHGFDWGIHDLDGGDYREIGLRWKPASPPQSTLKTIPLSWMRCTSELLAVAGAGESGSLQWALLEQENVVAMSAATDGDGTLAVAVIDEGLVAGVTRSGVVWYRPNGGKLTRRRVSDASIPLAVAAFPSLRTSELVVVRKDGVVERVPIPT